jgi:type II secretory pathway component GspD/PulD (secretin)
VARVNNGGTIVIGGWNGEVAINMDAGVPVLRSLPYVGKLLFNRNHDRIEKTNLLIFLTCNIVNP